jgi:predicted restriction endonuclease
MYRRCVIVGCHTHVSNTEPHHIADWNHGGRTDIELLVPLCKHHHDILHARSWCLTLDADRRLTIVKDSRVVMSTGPPAEQWA